MEQKTRPILFSGPMVRALLDGSKTQTRRVLKADFMHDPKGSLDAKWYFRVARAACWDSYETLAELVAQHCPYGQPGDRLWVRETWQLSGGGTGYWYAATDSKADDGNSPVSKWRPSIHMPREASRITLEITGVLVERPQDISDTDCVREGVTPAECTDCDGWVNAYSVLWESINGPGSWEANHWVWVVTFKRVEGGAA